MSETITDTALTYEAIEEEDTMHGKFLVFNLDGQEFAIAIEYVVDIINVQPYTRVPGCPQYIRGITNLRGKVIPVVDVRMRFGKEPQEYNDRTCIVVVEEQDATVGLIIDSVNEVITLEDEQIAPPPSFGNSAEARYVRGVGKADNGVKLILDCHAALFDRTVVQDVPEGETV